MTNETWLVALSVLMAIQGSYVGLQLAAGLNRSASSGHRLLLAGSAITLAVGIWSMHFVGMLAAKLPNEINFLVLPTLISFLTCVIVVGIGVAAVTMPARQVIRIPIGALAMGGGICLMHYIGMSALDATATLSYNPASVLLAFSIAVITSGVALWMLNRTTHPLPIWLAAIVLGIAVSGMHYTAIAGTTFALCEVRPDATSPAMTRDSLAIIVAFIAFSVSGGFLLSIIPDRTQGAPEHQDPRHFETGPAFHENAKEEEADFVHQEASDPATPDDGLIPGHATTEKRQFAESIPVEKDNRTRNLRARDIRSIRANAHYTYISDGQQEFFCKLSISAVEASLDPQNFIRVHRSYIIAIEHVESVRRQGENGIVELNGALVQCEVPVARTRLSVLQKRVSEQIRSARSDVHNAIRE